jgi:hypothetical protein
MGRMNSAAPWKRWLAVLSVVLLVLVPQAHSVLQHGASLRLPHIVSQRTSPVLVGEDTQLTDDDSPCTLCSVLGSATELASYQAARPVEQTLNLAIAKEHTFAPRAWSFDLFSRPPPSCSLGESAVG